MLPPRLSGLWSSALESNSNNIRNALLTALSPADRASLLPRLEFRDFAARQLFEEPNRPVRFVYFMERGFASVVLTAKGERGAEVGLIGREGVSGLAVLMGNDRSPYATYAQTPGAAFRLAANAMRDAMAASPPMRRLLLNFAYSFMIQAAHTAVANVRGTIDQRLARWLLMAHDRVNGDNLPLSHELVSIMLGVRRAGVTVAVSALANRGLISRSRGNIMMVDRPGLERIAGSYYGAAEAEYRRIVESRPARARSS